MRRRPVVAFCLLLAAASWPVQVVSPDAVGLALVGPSVCGFVIAFVVGGRREAGILWRRVLRWRVPAGWYLVALTGIGACAVGVAYLVTALSYPDDLAAPSVPLVLTLLVNVVLVGVVAGLGEQFGWRGFLLPRLQERGGPVRASLVVGLLWAVWHWPKGLVEQQPPQVLLWFTVGVVGASFVYTWLFNGTGGSVLLVALAHGAENAWSGHPYRALFSFEPPGFMFFDALREATAVVLAALVLAATRGRLGLRHRPTP